MLASDYWHLFLKTGSPEVYLMYSNAKRTEEEYVSECAGTDFKSVSLQ